MNTSYDYVIVGAGAAGCVLANRLSADPGTSVLLLEAGGADTSPLVKIPAGFSMLMGTKLNWVFDTVPQRNMLDRRMFLPQGKGLGGSTSVNAMLYVRGNRDDYDTWRDLGNKGWGYDDVLPYFKKQEANERIADEFHGVSGELNVADQVQHAPVSWAFVRAAQEAGIPWTSDPNGKDQEGVFFHQVTQRNARRESASTAFLHPVRKRPNLTVVTGADVQRIDVENGRATGVTYLRKNQEVRVTAARETLLAAGAFNSPRLLMLSGIGDSEELAAVGVRPVHHLPGVGKNLHDQLEVYITAEAQPRTTYNGENRPHRAALHGLQYLMFKTGPATATITEAGAFVKSDPSLAQPDLQLHMLPAYVVWEDLARGANATPGSGITILSCHIRPKSRGTIKLASADPGVMPLVDPNYLDHPEDVAAAVNGFKVIRKVLEQEAFKVVLKDEQLPGRGVETDEEILAYIRQWAKTDYHPVGTCKMGVDDLAVVDPELRVHGLAGLRVIDSSIMPNIISGNTQAPSMMIGEKGAALILGEDPL